MDGPVCGRRLAAVQRSYAPTRLAEDTLTSVYERVVHVRLVAEEISESAGLDVPGSESAALVLTGGQHA